MEAKLSKTNELTNKLTKKMCYDFSEDRNYLSNRIYNALLSGLKSAPYSDHQTPQMQATYGNYVLNIALDTYEGAIDYEIYIKINGTTEELDLTQKQQDLLLPFLESERQIQEYYYQKDKNSDRDMQDTYNSLWRTFM